MIQFKLKCNKLYFIGEWTLLQYYKINRKLESIVEISIYLKEILAVLTELWLKTILNYISLSWNSNSNY